MTTTVPTFGDVADARDYLDGAGDLPALRDAWRDRPEPMARADLVAALLDAAQTQGHVFLAPEAVACVLEGEEPPFAVAVLRGGRPVGWLGPDNRIARHEREARAFSTEAAGRAALVTA